MGEAIVGVIGGTGLAEALAGESPGEAVEVDTPFGKPSAPLVRTRLGGVEVVFLKRHGEGHRLPPTAVPFRANVYALRQLGVTHVLASGAVGSLRPDYHPGDLVLVDQAIDKTYRRAGSFFDEGPAVHVDLSCPVCPTLHRRLAEVSREVDFRVHVGGTYVCMEGPAFSTQAESHMHRAWGGDVIGMTLMPEARLAREAEMCYAMVALVTDYDCWKPHPPDAPRPALIAEIMGNLRQATANGIALLRRMLERFAEEPPGIDCACQRSLEMAIWTDRRRIDGGQMARLGLLLGRYVSGGG